MSTIIQIEADEDTNQNINYEIATSTVEVSNQPSVDHSIYRKSIEQAVVDQTQDAVIAAKADILTTYSKTETDNAIAAAQNTGATGATGLQGIQGIQGDDGIQGIQGIQGLTGAAGSDGTDGAQGIQGLTGSAGSDGSDGIQGIQGIQGLTGVAGSDGSNGSNGADGISAYQVAVNGGFIGTEAVWLLSLDGSDGAQGIQGLTGSAGSDGTDGAQGIQGLTGAAGADGDPFDSADYELTTSVDAKLLNKSDSNHTHAANASKLDVSVFNTDKTAQEGRLDALEAAPDNDTIYNDAALSARVTDLELIDHDIVDLAPYETIANSDSKLLNKSNTNHTHAADTNKLDVSVFNTDKTAQEGRLNALEAAPDNDTIYNDTALSARVTDLELTDHDIVDLAPYETIANSDAKLLNKSDSNHTHSADASKLDVSVFNTDKTAQEGRLDALEAAPDNDTIYDDTALSTRVTDLELTDHDIVDLSPYETMAKSDAKLLKKADMEHTNYALSNPYLNANPFFDNGVEDYVQIQGSDIVTDVVNNQSASFKQIGKRPISVLNFINKISIKQSLDYRSTFIAKCLYDGAVDATKVIKFYVGMTCFDSDDSRIQSWHNIKQANTTTDITSELNDGDTVINVTSTTNWLPNGSNTKHMITVCHPLRPDGTYGYIGLNGRYYEELKYTRITGSVNGGLNKYTDITATTITLDNPWDGGTQPVGTKISNGKAGGSYPYWISSYNQPCDGTWITKTTNWLDPANESVLFNGTASAQPMALMNYVLYDNGVVVSAPSVQAKFAAYISTMGFESRIKGTLYTPEAHNHASKLDVSTFNTDKTAQEGRLDALEATGYSGNRQPIIISGNQTLLNTDSVHVNSASSLTVTLPALPDVGDWVRVSDYIGNFSTYNLTINRNGQKIMNVSQDLTLNQNYSRVRLEYISPSFGGLLTA